MKRIFTILLVLTCFYSANAQNYPVGKRTITFIDNLRTDREIPTDVYYPATTAGNNVPLAAGIEKFPVVVFGHGFVMPASAYLWLADSLVKNGYVVAFPATEGGIAPSHLDFGLDLSFLCTRITSLNDSTGSFLYQRVIKRAAVAGHSMGGGASFLAAATQNTSIKALFNFAAAETIPSATGAAVLNRKPALIFSGSSDCVVPDSVQEAMYNNINLACKTYINITGALHCQFANNNAVCQAGQIFAGCGFTTLSTQTVFSKTQSLLLPFLDYYLKDICLRGEVFVNNYNNITGVTKRRACQPLPTCGVVPVKLLSFTGRVNNNRSMLNWITAFEDNLNFFELERSADGRNFSSFLEINAKGLNNQGAFYDAVDPFPFAGINFYRLRIVNNDGSYGYSNIVKLEMEKKAFALTQLYPNPVKQKLNFQLQSEKVQEITIQLFDISGKLLTVKKTPLSAGLNNSTLDFANFSGGSYLLRFTAVNGEKLGTYKIVKAD